MSALLCSVLLPLLLGLFLIKKCIKNAHGTTGSLPPGPRPIPVIGSIHLLTSLPHRAVAGHSKAYGPIMLLRLGSIPTVFISSPRLAEQVLKALDTASPARPFTEAACIYSYGGKDMTFAGYGPRWRKLRKLCINNLLATAKLESYGFVRREEVASFVERMKEVAQARAVADVTTKVRWLVADMVCRTVMGRKIMEDSMDRAEFGELIEELMRILAPPNLNDAVPLLAPFDLQGLRGRTKAVMRRVDMFLDEIIDDHEEGKGEDDADFIDVMLHSTDDRGSALDRTSAKAVILDMCLGAMDTSPVTIDWALVELLRHPRAMRKVREELERVVGLRRAVEESDIPELSYLAMVIKETLRLHTVAPFVVRRAEESAAVGGYRIPAPLLENLYFENCPGCIFDKKKDITPGIPYKELFFVWIIVLAAGLPISSLFPFLYFMIRDFHVAKRVEDIGFYAGFVGASFMLGRALTSVFWGMVADRWGRKPVIIFGLISSIIFNTLFGLSVNYWMAIATRFLLGALNGLLGPIKAYSTEVCRPEHQSIGLSMVSTAWAIALIIGPALGGFLAQPAEKFPDLFPEESLFGRFPYFLPNLCISVFAVGVIMACFWLPETLHNHTENTTDEKNEPLEASSCCSAMREKDVEAGGRSPYKENLLMNWPLMSSIIVYCVFSLHDMAYGEIFSLWAESDRRFGGLSFSSGDVGQVLSVTGFSLLVFQLFIYPPAVGLLGPINVARIAAVISIPLLSGYPFMTKLSGLLLSIVVNAASILKNVLSMSIITGTFILQNNAVPQHQRGAANGISMTGMSIFKAIAPAAAGVIFSWAQKRQHAFFLPGDHMVFFMLNVVAFVGLLMTFKPFLVTKS